MVLPSDQKSDKKRIKKRILFFVSKTSFAAALIAVFCVTEAPAYFSQLPDYICEIGMNHYRKGHYKQALEEFKRALLAEPDYLPARKYIEMTERTLAGIPEEVPGQEAPEEFFPEEAIRSKGTETIMPGEAKTMDEYLDMVELQREMISEREKAEQIIPLTEEGLVVPAGPILAQLAPAPVIKRTFAPKELFLDESLAQLRQPLEIEQGESVLIRGVNIQRFLVTQPNVLDVERKDTDTILATGKDLGYTFLHAWDNSGRWTIEFMTVPPRPLGPTLEEELRQAEESARNFKLRYIMDWSDFQTGRNWGSLNDTSSSWMHSLTFFGETPYGSFDSSLSATTYEDGTTELSYTTVGLTQGKIGNFQDFNLRFLDFDPALSNLILWGGNLRGVMLNSPAFDQKLDYTVFYGQEGGGLYGGYTPGFTTQTDSYLAGVDVNLYPAPKQKYGFSVVSGWGDERLLELNDYGYDADFSYDFSKGNLSGDVAFDSEKFAYLLNSTYAIPTLTLTSEFRNIDKNFQTMSGLGSRAGELGMLANLFYTPREDLSVDARMDIYKDRLFPNPKDPDAWNQDVGAGMSLQTDPSSTWRIDYTLQNDLGKVGAVRNQNAGIGLNKYFEWIRRINTYLLYRFNKTRNYSAPSLDYVNNRILAGLSFNIVKDLNYFINEELGWVVPDRTQELATPRAFQTGLDWYKQIFKSPFGINLRFMYRDEEDAESPFSFLSGEDYIEGYGEVSYKPKPDIEAFLNMRVRNVWAENPGTRKYMDVNFYSGLRCLWDTGLSWESVGAVEGYVFKDENGDGLRQRDEAPVEGIKVWLGKDKSQTTDLFGSYRFNRVRARKAFVNIDTTTVPTGFLLTTPATQEAPIIQGKPIEINFGISSRTEVSGVIFDDPTGKNELSPDSVGVKGVAVYLEDGTRAVTDDYGRYSFRKMSLGAHKLSLDLSTVPGSFIPTVPVFVDFELTEGQSFNYNIPLKKSR
jgi:hypothetical protein